MRLIQSLLLVFFFSSALSDFFEPDTKSEPGKAAVISEKSQLDNDFFNPKSDSEKLTSTPTPKKTETSSSLKTAEVEVNKKVKNSLLSKLDSEATTAPYTSKHPKGESKDILKLLNSISFKVDTNSTAEESRSDENSSSEESEESDDFKTFEEIDEHHHKSKKPQRLHKRRRAKPTETPVPVTVTPITDRPTRHNACHCDGGVCACCTGALLESLHIPVHRRACVNIEYEPEDFAFRFKIFWNKKLLFNERMSACIPINRYFGVKMCAKLSNVYVIGHNMHACLDLEGTWDDEVAFNYPFNCFRIGTKGVAAVQPEDGGGLGPPPDEEEQVDEDYDDSARQAKSHVEVVKV